MRAALLVVVAALALACDSGPECGPGTTEVAGICLSDAEPRPAQCGPRTEWDDDTQTCVGLSRVVCAAGTVAVEQDDGTVICYGSGSQPQGTAR